MAPGVRRPLAGWLGETHRRHTEEPYSGSMEKQASYGIGILLRDLGVYFLVSHIQRRPD